MLDFLKRFGLGILYVLISPFVIAFLLLWALFDLSVYFVGLIKAFGSFFKGKKMFPDFPEDVEAKRILSLEPYANDPTQSQVNQAQPVNNNPNDNGGASSI